jgi:hypothetical protein
MQRQRFAQGQLIKTLAVLDGLEGDAPQQPVGGRKIDAATAYREWPDQLQDFMMSQRIQRIPRVDNPVTLGEPGGNAKFPLCQVNLYRDR